MQTTADTFDHETIAIHINQQFRQVLVLKVALATFNVACFWGLSDVYMSARMIFKWFHLPWTSRQPAVIHHTTAAG